MQFPDRANTLLGEKRSGEFIGFGVLQRDRKSAVGSERQQLIFGCGNLLSELGRVFGADTLADAVQV